MRCSQKALGGRAAQQTVFRRPSPGSGLLLLKYTRTRQNRTGNREVGRIRVFPEARFPLG
jgi:hypothetical protein